jgi:hypothetical protein
VSRALNFRLQSYLLVLDIASLNEEHNRATIERPEGSEPKKMEQALDEVQGPTSIIIASKVFAESSGGWHEGNRIA